MKIPAVIFDRDGTLAGVDRRFVTDGNDDWHGFNASIPFDVPVPAVAGLFRSIKPGIFRIVTTGRMANTRPRMLDWFHKHDLVPDLLLMRQDRDTRADSIVKREIYERVIAPRFDVLYVVDDRPQVCDMWRDVGLPLLQVTQPDDLPLFPNFPEQAHA